MNGDQETSQQRYTPPARTSFSTQEMANNSLWNIHRELVDNGKVELHNQHLNELPLSTTPTPTTAPTLAASIKPLRTRHLGSRGRHAVSERPIHSVPNSRSRIYSDARVSPFRSLNSEPITIGRADLQKALPPIPISTPEARSIRASPAGFMSRARSVISSVATVRSSTSFSGLESAWGEHSRRSSSSTPLSESMQVSPLALRPSVKADRTRLRSRSETTPAATAATTYAMVFDYDIYRGKNSTRRQVVNGLK